MLIIVYIFNPRINKVIIIIFWSFICIIPPPFMCRTPWIFENYINTRAVLEEMQYVCNPFQTMFHLLSIRCTILLHFSSGICLYQVSNGNIWTMCEICSKLTKYCSGVSIFELEQVNSGWVTVEFHKTNNFFRTCVITRWYIYKIVLNVQSCCKLGHFYILPFPSWSLQ